jgi:hypothetical protein
MGLVLYNILSLESLVTNHALAARITDHLWSVRELLKAA